jgi:glycosyltransferase involved in cell wall biosynthesis
VFAELYGHLPSAQALHEVCPRLNGKVVALFLGRLHPKKGFGLLMPALAEAVKLIPDLHLLVAGPDEGGYKAQLDTLIEQYALQDHVTFLGMVQGQRKLEAFGAAHFFVLPSHQEGDSVAVKEAMASGLPVVITPACHFPDVTINQAGLVVEPQVQVLTNALLTLGGNECLRQQMGCQARLLVKEHYTWQAIAHRLVREYEHILPLAGQSRGGAHV